MAEYGQPERQADQQLEETVRRILSDNRELEANPIEIVACQGVVELSGMLPTADLREFAEQQALAAEGVDRVVNRIQVDGSPA